MLLPLLAPDVTPPSEAELESTAAEDAAPLPLLAPELESTAAEEGPETGPEEGGP